MNIAMQTQMVAATGHYVDEEPAAQILERRWFATLAAVKNLQAECEVLLGVVYLAVDDWRRTRAKLTQLEALREALGERLAAMDEPWTLDEYAERSHTRTVHEVQLPPVVPGCAAARTSLSHEQVFPAEGPSCRRRSARSHRYSSA